MSHTLTIPWFLPAHMALEMLCSFLMLVIFLLNWSAYTADRPRNMVVFSCFSLSAAILGFIHMASYEGMPSFVTANNPHKAIVFWLAVRFMIAGTLLAVVIMPWKPLGNAFSRYVLLGASLGITMLIVWIGLFHEEWIPQTFVPGSGLTAFKVYAERSFMAVCALIIVVLAAIRRDLPGIHRGNLITALGFLLLSGLFFSSYTQVTDALNLAGHFLQLIAYFFIYRSVLHDTVHIPFIRLTQAEKQLQACLLTEQEQARMLSIIEHSADLIATANTKGEALYYNTAACNLLGIKQADIRSTLISSTHPERINKLLFEHFLPEAASNGIWQGESVFLNKDGGEIPVSQIIIAHKDSSGEVEYYSTICRDITEQKQSEEQQKLADILFETAAEGFMITDAKQVIQRVNRAFQAITGYDEQEVLGKTPRILSSGWHSAEFYNEIWLSIQEKGQWSGEIWNKQKSGELYLEDITINAVTNEAGEVTHYAAVFKNITERKKLEAQLLHRASHDVITELPNRALLYERFEQAKEYARAHNRMISVMLLDLDGFKKINDHMGHSAGDDVLRMVAERLNGNIRATDTAARLGGDEFAILLTDLRHPEDSFRVAEKLCAAMSQPFELSHQRVHVTTSIGICTYPEHGDELDTLLKHADQAMYQVKHYGKNNYRIYDASKTSGSMLPADMTPGTAPNV